MLKEKLATSASTRVKEPLALNDALLDIPKMDP